MARLASLPEDIIIDILSILPVKSICRMKCVCKLWYDLIKNPKFIKMHLRRAIENDKFSVLLCSKEWDVDDFYTIDFDATSSSYHMPVAIERPLQSKGDGSLYIFSSDGLLGSRHYYANKIFLWNPLTREYKHIPISNHNESFDKIPFEYGFFYDWKVDDYKFFKLVAQSLASNTSEVWVRRLGSNSWNSIGSIPCSIYDTDISTRTLNGIIHWITNTKIIVSFDIVEERTKDIQIPRCYLDNEAYSYEGMEVRVMGYNIYLSACAAQGDIDLWVMKDYGVIDSWTKVFSFSTDEISFDKLLPLHYLNKNREILLHGKRNEGADALVSYDSNSGRLVTLDIPCIPKHFDATTFVGSLVSLNSGEFVEVSRESNKFFTMVEVAISFCLKWFS